MYGNNNIGYMNNAFCQKVLPLTYDESLSYYEFLCKLTHKINEVIEWVNGSLEQTLINYVDEKFNSIMINAIYNESTETIIFAQGVKNNE
jgi:hypothetical protein